MNTQQIATAENERDRRKHIEPDRGGLAPTLCVRNEISGNQREAGNRSDNQRNLTLHVNIVWIRKSTNACAAEDLVTLAMVAPTTPATIPAATMSLPTSWPLRDRKSVV